MEESGLKAKDLKRFKEVLLAKKKEILRNAQRTLNEDMTLDADDLPDEMDLASSEYLHSFTFRLRGREKVFLQKIDHACENCHLQYWYPNDERAKAAAAMRKGGTPNCPRETVAEPECHPGARRAPDRQGEENRDSLARS